LAGFASHPLDVLRARYQSKELQKSNGYMNFDLFTSQYLLDTHNLSRQEAPSGMLFSGLVARLLHISLGFTVTLLWFRFLSH